MRRDFRAFVTEQTIKWTTNGRKKCPKPQHHRQFTGGKCLFNGIFSTIIKSSFSGPETNAHEQSLLRAIPFLQATLIICKWTAIDCNHSHNKYQRKAGHSTCIDDRAPLSIECNNEYKFDANENEPTCSVCAWFQHHLQLRTIRPGELQATRSDSNTQITIFPFKMPLFSNWKCHFFSNRNFFPAQNSNVAVFCSNVAVRNLGIVSFRPIKTTKACVTGCIMNSVIKMTENGKSIIFPLRSLPISPRRV